LIVERLTPEERREVILIFAMNNPVVFLFNDSVFPRSGYKMHLIIV
jgi:hypothetical protein